MAEPLACVLNALSLSPVNLNDTMVLIGAGPIGLMICEVARIMGAGKIILVNRSRPRLETAKKLGLADVYVCGAQENAVERVLKETGGLGADVIFTANPSPDSQSDAIKMAKNRARVNFFGGLPKGTLVTLDTNAVHYKELFVTGAHGSMPHQHEAAVNLIAGGRIGIKKFITHEFPLDRIADAFKAAEEHAGLRVVVKP